MESGRARRKAKGPTSSSAGSKVSGRPRDARIDMEVISAVIAALLDMLTGPFYFRTLFRRASMSLEDAAQIVDYVVRLIEPHRQTHDKPRSAA